MTSGYGNAPVVHVRMPEWQKVLVALGVSLLVNAVFFFFIGISVALHSDVKSKSLEKLKVVEVAVARPTPTPIPVFPMPVQPASPPTPVIDSDDLHKTEKAPKNPVFESDQNLVAGSKQPATGNVPLPSQEGKTRDELAFSTHKYSLGPGTGATEVPPVMVFAPAPDVIQQRPERTPAKPMQPVATPVPTPEAKPSETPKVEQKTAETPTPAPSTPAPSTPAPSTLEVPIYRPTPVPVATVEPTPDFLRPTPAPTPQPVATMAMLTPPKPAPQVQPVPPQQPGYRPETQENKIEGSISNRDQPGVDAISTPKGRYEKKISDAIRGRWYYYVDQRRDLIAAGSVRIRFFINQDGAVEDLSIVSNDSNAFLAGCSVDAINRARFSPPPPDLAPSLENGRFEVIYTFRIYPYQ